MRIKNILIILLILVVFTFIFSAGCISPNSSTQTSSRQVTPTQTTPIPKYSTVPITIPTTSGYNPFISGIGVSHIATPGKDFWIIGTASGNPQYVYLWIFGPNFKLLSQEVPVNRDNSFTYKIPSSTTLNFDSGTYYCLLQHPMQNGVQDLFVSGNNIVKIRDSDIQFDMNIVSGAQATAKWVELINQPYIDDSYTKFIFEV